MIDSVFVTRKAWEGLRSADSVYHLKISCTALNQNTSGFVSVSIEDAKRKGFTHCRICCPGPVITMDLIDKHINRMKEEFGIT